MRLTDLNPQFIGAGGPGTFQADGSPTPARHGVGLMFDCPHGVSCPSKQGVEFPEFAGKLYVGFENPLDGGPIFDPTRPKWHREGETFDTLTLTPSILSVKERGGCGWHGFIRNGEIIEA